MGFGVTFCAAVFLGFADGFEDTFLKQFIYPSAKIANAVLNKIGTAKTKSVSEF